MTNVVIFYFVLELEAVVTIVVRDQPLKALVSHMKNKSIKKWVILGIAVLNGLVYIAAKGVLYFGYSSDSAPSAPRWIDVVDILSKVVMAVMCLYIMVLFIFLANALRHQALYENGELSKRQKLGLNLAVCISIFHVYMNLTVFVSALLTFFGALCPPWYLAFTEFNTLFAHKLIRFFIGMCFIALFYSI